MRVQCEPRGVNVRHAERLIATGRMTKAGLRAFQARDERRTGVYSFERRDPNGNAVVIVCNMTPVVRHDYAIGVSREGSWREPLNTDAGIYGGSNIRNEGTLDSRPVPMHGRQHSLQITLPPLATIMLVPS